MNKFYKGIFLIAFTLSANLSNAVTWIVTTPGFSFSPAPITITLGDTVLFNIGSNHNAVEVSQTTWVANGNTSNGGFATSFGGGTVIPTQVKTYYFVCQPHANMGMKGQIIVTPSTGIPIVEAEDKVLKFNPNPVSTKTLVHTGIADGLSNNLIVFDITGKEVHRVENIVNNYALDLGFLKNGIYFAEFNTKGYRRTGKIVISKN